MNRPAEALTGDAVDRAFPLGCQVRAIGDNARGAARTGLRGMIGIVIGYDNAGEPTGHCGLMVSFPRPHGNCYIWTTEVAAVEMITVGSRVRSLGIMAAGSNCSNRGMRAGLIGIIISRLPHDGDILVDWGVGVSGHTGQGEIQTPTGLYMFPSEIEMVTLPIEGPAMTSVSVPSVPRLRVTITRPSAAYEQWMLTITNGPSISPADIKAQLSREYQRMVPVRIWNAVSDTQRLVHRAIENHSIPVEVMLAACQAAAIAKQARDRQGIWTSEQLPADLAEIVADSPALLAIGDKLFQLTPQGVISGSRGIALIRARVTERAKGQAERLLTAARTEARGLIASGERQLSAIREMIASEQRAAEMTLPGWVIASQYQVRASGDATFPWAIAITVNTKVDTFVINSSNGAATLSWDAVSISHPRDMALWLPINFTTGAFNYERVIPDQHSMGKLPHINSYCCMSLQGMPEKVTGGRELRMVTDAINRGQRVVNLSSLLSAFNHWHPDVIAQTPAVIASWLRGGARSSDLDALALTANTSIPVREEAAETFTIEDVRRAIQ